MYKHSVEKKTFVVRLLNSTHSVAQNIPPVVLLLGEENPSNTNIDEK